MFRTHSNQCWRRIAITLADGFSAPHSSHINTITDCMHAIVYGLLVGFATLYAYCFRLPSKQSDMLYADIAIDQQGRQSGAVVTVVMSICGLQRLSRASAEPGPGWPAGHPTKDCNNCLWSHLWVICRWHCLLRCHNYCAPPSVWPLCACCQSLSDQLTWLTSRHLTRWLCANSVGLWGTGCS